MGKGETEPGVLPLWSQSKADADFLLAIVRDVFDHQRQRAFLDHLGLCISRRVGAGRIPPEWWILHCLPEDIARAAVLTCMGG